MAILADSFYYQELRIDTINTRVFADLVAKEGDANGRGLLVTLTENGLMKDTTGITLILKWEHTSVGNQGLDNFEAVDPSKGLYKITYPTEMLNRGTVRAFIQIIDSGKLAGVRNIEITVDRGVGDDTAIASSDSFTALAQALIDVNSNKSELSARILSVEQQLTETANDIDTSLTPRITSVEQELAATVNDIDTSLTPRILSVEQDLVAVKSTDTSHASRILSVEQQLALISGGIEAIALPTGDGSLAYWQTVPDGCYHAALGSVTGQPRPSGLIHVIRNESDFSAIWYDLTSQNVYRLYGSAAAINGWTLISGAPVTFAPTLLSGWVNYGDSFAAAGYYKGPDNRVHLQGLIKSGTVADGTVIFTLPQGFRPLKKEMFIVFISGGGYGRVDVYDNGSVVAKIVNATYTSLSGISFLAKN